MGLILLSLACGFLAVVIATYFGTGATRASGTFNLAVWLTGFLMPGLYVLEKLLRKLNEKSSSEK